MLLQKKDNRNWVFWLTLFVLFCLGVYALKSVLLPFVAGIIIGYLLDPWADCFVRHGINRTLATVLVLLLVVIVMVPALIILFSIIDEQVGRFLNALPQYISTFVKKSNRSYRNFSPGFLRWKPTKSKHIFAATWPTVSNSSARSFAASSAAALLSSICCLCC